MTARDAILQAVRAARPAAFPLPDVQAATRTFVTSGGDLAARFAEAARLAGADVAWARRSEAPRVILEASPSARRIVSVVPTITVGTVPLPDAPHELADVDLFVCEAVLGVAENGAVWLPEFRLGQRAAAFIAANVAVVLDRSAIVANLHDAYARLDVAGEPFGVFIAGPSKTADIEQSLVIGAHGPKSLTIILASV